MSNYDYIIGKIMQVAGLYRWACMVFIITNQA